MPLKDDSLFPLVTPEIFINTFIYLYFLSEIALRKSFNISDLNLNVHLN